MADRYTIEISLDGKDNVSQHLSKVNRELDTLQSQGQAGAGAANNVADGLTGMISAAQGVAAALGLMEIGQKVMELNELGAEVRATNRVFTELTGGPEAAAKGMNELRAATNGIVDDMTLMNGTNSLLLTGLAQTTEEAAGLTEVAVKLGGALGQGPADAIENLNAALLNNSFQRLDTLGISAAKVRERVLELKEAGMDMSEAFSQAVLEQGRLAIEKLGDAANAGVTATNLLATQWENATQKAAELTNQVIETGAQLLILAQIGLGGTGGIPAMEEQRAQQEAYNQQLQETITLAEQYEQQILALDDSFYQTDFAGNWVLAMTDAFNDTKAVEYFLNNPEMSAQFSTAGESAGHYFRDAFNSSNPIEIENARNLIQDVFDFDISQYTDEELAQFAAEADLAFTVAATAQRELGYEIEATTAAAEEQTRAMTLQQSVMEAAGHVFNIVGDEMNTLERGFQNLSASFDEGIFTSGGNTFFDPAAAQAVRSEAERLADEYERIKELGESSEFELVSEVEVARAREIAANADQMADDAERMADSWENASLSMLAGTNNADSRLNEFYQGVLSQIEDPTMRAQAESQFNLASGVETPESRIIEYGQALTAAITDTFGVAAGQRAGQDFVDAFVEGTRQGLSGEALQDYVEEQVGYAFGEGGSQQVTVQQGEGYIALAQRTGIDRATLEAANGGAMLLAGQVITVGDGTSLIAVNGSPEDLLVPTINDAGNNVFNTIMHGMSRGGEGTVPSDYTYYNPETRGYDYSNNPEITPPPLVSPETSEAVSSAADDFLSIETSVQNISSVDTSAVFMPVIDNISSANVQLEQFRTDIANVVGREYRMRMGLVPYIDFANVPELAGNPAFIELFATVIRTNPQIVRNVIE